MTKEAFVKRFYPPAVQATRGTGLFPETFVAQAALETGWGTSKHAGPLVNNFSGIKANSTWPGKVISSSTWEIINGKREDFKGTNKIYPSRAAALNDGAHVQTLFRVFPDERAGIVEWVKFLQDNPRYEKVFKATTPEAQFAELKAANYATATNYVATVTSIYRSLMPYFKSIGTTIKDNGAFFFSGNATDNPSLN